jgi:hypothetical protein
LFFFSGRLKVYNDNKMYEKVFQLYNKLKQNRKNTIPDQITFSSLLYSTAKMGDAEQCQRIINDLNASSICLDDHYILQVNLINSLSKCGDIVAGKFLF